MGISTGSPGEREKNDSSALLLEEEEDKKAFALAEEEFKDSRALQRVHTCCLLTQRLSENYSMNWHFRPPRPRAPTAADQDPPGDSTAPAPGDHTSSRLEEEAGVEEDDEEEEEEGPLLLVYRHLRPHSMKYI